MFYNVEAQVISSLNAMTMNKKDVPRLKSWSVIQCTLWPN
jgi:hypothetical protein